MCGIVGAVGSNLDIDSLEKSLDFLKHRGPDANGTWKSANCWLGHTRLSILDLNVRSNQPFRDYVDDLVLVFNGEIYNFKDLREILIKDKIHFKTNSDTEVILHSWRKWGSECFKKFKGMFAIAIWNPQKDELILARDRFGEKPLYYINHEKKFFFASELKMISNFISKLEIDPYSINDYFYWGYIPSPNTLFKDIRKLKPGYFGKFTQSQFTENSYYDRPKQSISSNLNNSSIIYSKLRKAVNRSLISDVPVGIALSGGIDSCAIAAIAKKDHNKRLDCISVGYEVKTLNDERKEARQVAKRYGHNFHEVEISNNDISENFLSFTESLDEPISDIAAFAYNCIFKKANEIGLKAIISGIGGDEFFWGYNMYNSFCIESQIRQLKRRCLPKSIFQMFSKKYYGWNNQILWNSKNMISEYFQPFLISQEELEQYRMPAYTLTRRKKERWSEAIQRVLIENWLEGNCLALNDRLSMQHSVECRAPFLDADLTDHALSLKTTNQSLRRPKNNIKMALSHLLPKHILYKPKAGFTPPVNLWKTLICNNLKSEIGKCDLLKEIVRINTIASRDIDLIYKLTVLSTLINKYV